MSKNPHFKLRAVGDAIIASIINIEDNETKRRKKLQIEMAGGMPPKNIMDIEKEKAREYAKYNKAIEEFDKAWDENPMQAVVVAVGPGRAIDDGVYLPMEVKVGDRLYVRPQSGELIKYKGEVYIVLRPHEIYCVDPEPRKSNL